MAELKSLAHPEWPYSGTVHEWRGFVESKEECRFPDCTCNPACDTHAAIYQKQNFGPKLD